LQIKTDQFAEAAREALKDTYTRIFLDGMHRKVKERLASMGTFPDPAAARKLGAAIAVAETGTIINVENEGNIRFNKSSPRIQVSIWPRSTTSPLCP